MVYPPAATISSRAFFEKSATRDVAAAVDGDSAGTAKGEAAAELFDGGVTAGGQHIIDRVFAVVCDEDIGAAVESYSRGLAETEARASRE